MDLVDPPSQVGGMQVESSSGPLILIADDNEDNRIVFTAVLRHAGFRVLTVENGTAAVEQALRHRPALMVLDLKMPGMTGDQAMRRLNADPATADIPAIVATADDTYTPAAAREDGFCAYLRKPLLPNHLRRAVEHCLARWSPAERWVELPDFARGERADGGNARFTGI
jgi:CheY-like chemotaxis protein